MLSPPHTHITTNFLYHLFFSLYLLQSQSITDVVFTGSILSHHRHQLLSLATPSNYSSNLWNNINSAKNISLSNVIEKIFDNVHACNTTIVDWDVTNFSTSGMLICVQNSSAITPEEQNCICTAPAEADNKTAFERCVRFENGSNTCSKHDESLLWQQSSDATEIPAAGFLMLWLVIDKHIICKFDFESSLMFFFALDFF